MLIGLIMLAVVMWILQTILAVRQFNRFNRHIKELRKSGKVAIGKAKGKLRAGAIVMFLIDDNLKIVKGEIMNGFTSLARIKEFNNFNDVNLLDLDADMCKGLNKQIAEAVMATRKDYLDYQEMIANQNMTASVTA